MVVKELLSKLANIPDNVDVYINVDSEEGTEVGALVDVQLDGTVNSPKVNLVGKKYGGAGDKNYMVGLLESYPEEAEVYIQVGFGEVVPVHDIDGEMVDSEEPHLVVFGGFDEY